jgi:glycine dehydrogenase
VSDYTNPVFADRHIGPDSDAVATMLEVIGVDSLEELARRAVPAGILDKLTATGAAPGLDQLPPPASEALALAELRALADTNTDAVSMIGQGYYDTLTPPVLLRNIMENPAWYTAYTPYQPEISQGRLEALLNFQTMVADLTGLEVANSSMLDEGTAAAEAMTLMHRAVKGSANRLAVDVDVFAQTAAVLACRTASSSVLSRSCPGPADESPTGLRWCRRHTTAVHWWPSVRTCWR